MSVSPWARDLFGDEQAVEVQAALGRALRAVQTNAEQAHYDAQSQKNHVYGIARWAGQYERIADEVGALSGATKIKPRGFPFELVHVGRGLLYPFCYAKSKADVRQARIPNVSGLVRDLFTFAPALRVMQDMLDPFQNDETEMEHELRGQLATLPPETRLVLVPFACNTSGFLDAYWGVAALNQVDGRLEWQQVPDPLALPAATARPGTIPSPSSEPIPAPAVRSFDSGEEPPLNFNQRPASETGLDVPPETEADPIDPRAAEDDES
ncbi:putative membrane protein [Streptacidiphilus sp. MAP12-20]|uniref:hypothetical protein n=1 Tax=Streptacidiphilus sp. MAP12-20 TaxID=3156299 RepID=UPI003515A80E